MNATTVKYNGVTIHHCVTREFHQEPIRTVDGSDLERVRYTVTVQGFIRELSTSDWNSIDGPRMSIDDIPNAHHVADLYAELRARLEQPRGEFEMLIGTDADGNGGRPLLYAVPQSESQDNNDIDVNNGPRTTSVRIESIAGGRTLRVTVTFEIYKADCFGSSSTDPVLSNKWRCVDSIDKDWYTTRTYTGVLKLRRSDVNPNDYRTLCLPTLVPGMKRQSITFDVSEDKLTLAYTVVDREAPWSAPPPATSWEIDHHETTADATLAEGTISVRMIGTRSSDPADMIGLAIRIVEDRLATGGFAAQNPTWRLLNLTVSRIISSESPNEIRVTCHVQHTRFDDTTFRIIQARLTRPVDGNVIAGYNNDVSPDPGWEASIPFVGAFLCYLQGYCGDQDHDIGSADTSSDGVAFANTPDGPDVIVRVPTVLPGEPPTWASLDTTASIYTHYKAQSTYQSSNTRVQLPIAKANGDLSTGEPTAAIVGLGLPTTIRVVDIEVERVGSAPVIQAPVDVYDDFVNYSSQRTGILLSSRVIANNPSLSPDGKPVWYLNVQYQYAMDRAIARGENLLLGIDPTMPGQASSLPAASLDTYTEQSTIT